MSFNTYKNIGQVLKEYSIRSEEISFIQEQPIIIREIFKEELAFSLREFVVGESEYAVCETIIFPILREIYRSYRDKFTLWSHKTIIWDEQLSGQPDYLLAKRSPLGKEVFEQPFFVTIEAKKDDFMQGWGQCLAEMIAIQKINKLSEEQTTFGIVSNGQIWQFGKLEKACFTKNSKVYLIQELDKLFAALNYIFQQCELQLKLVNNLN